jgi:hypothetical protein
MAPIPKAKLHEYETKGPTCPVVPTRIADLSSYFGTLASLITTEQPYWFRGLSDLKHELVPAALRYKTAEKRTAALNLVSEFRRYAEIKIARPPGKDDELKWLQLAQHHGLATRLLDWSENAAVALYFACHHTDRSGAVYMLNPIELNLSVDKKRPRVLDAERDSTIIKKYLSLTGRQDKRGRQTIAIYPVMNSDRIVLQRGAFTVHGAKNFGLDSSQATSLVKIPILGEHKEKLMLELDRIGIGEMTIFPELEHLCSYLKRRIGG